MIIALCIVGYIVMGIITAAVGYAMDGDDVPESDDDEFFMLGIAAIWPVALAFFAVLLSGVAVLDAAKWVGRMPHRRKRKAEVQRDAVRDMWREELKANPPDSVRHFVAAEMLKLHGEDR